MKCNFRKKLYRLGGILLGLCVVCVACNDREDPATNAISGNPTSQVKGALPEGFSPVFVQLQKMSSRKHGVAAQAKGEICAMGERAVPALLFLAQRRDRYQAHAIEVLGEMGVSTAIPIVIPYLQDASATLRQAAAETLGKLQARESVELLLGLLTDAEWNVAEAAAQALGNLADPGVIASLSERLKASDYHLRRAAVHGLGCAKLQSTVSAIIPLALQDESWQVRVQAIGALGKIRGEEAQETLLTALGSTDRSMALAAVKALSWKDNHPAVEPLGILLNTPVEIYEDKEIRRAIPLALAAIGDRRAVGFLLQALAKTNDQRMRVILTLAVGEVGGNEAIASLRQRLHEEDVIVRRNVIYALRACGSDVPDFLWIEASKDSDRLIAETTADHLAKQRIVSCIPHLFSWLAKAEPFPPLAQRALETLTQKKFSSLEEWFSWWEGAQEYQTVDGFRSPRETLQIYSQALVQEQFATAYFCGAQSSRAAISLAQFTGQCRENKALKQQWQKTTILHSSATSLEVDFGEGNPKILSFVKERDGWKMVFP